MQNFGGSDKKYYGIFKSGSSVLHLFVTNGPKDSLANATEDEKKYILPFLVLSRLNSSTCRKFPVSILGRFRC